MDAESLAAKAISSSELDNYNCYATVNDAYQHALQKAETDDRILIFGSFHTVEAIMRILPEFNLKNK